MPAVSVPGDQIGDAELFGAFLLMVQSVMCLPFERRSSNMLISPMTLLCTAVSAAAQANLGLSVRAMIGCAARCCCQGMSALVLGSVKISAYRPPKPLVVVCDVADVCRLDLLSSSAATDDLMSSLRKERPRRAPCRGGREETTGGVAAAAAVV